MTDHDQHRQELLNAATRDFGEEPPNDTWLQEGIALAEDFWREVAASDANTDMISEWMGQMHPDAFYSRISMSRRDLVERVHAAADALYVTHNGSPSPSAAKVIARMRAFAEPGEGALASAWAKLVWGDRHLQAFVEESLSHLPRMHGTQRVTNKLDPSRGGLVTTVTMSHQLPRELGLIVGDALGSYRAALDHLAWAAVSRGTCSEVTLDKRALAVAFPIVDPGAKVNFDRTMPGADQVLRDLVPPMEPTQDGDAHPLIVLRDLSNEDKHRETKLTLLTPVGGDGRIDYRDFEPTGLVQAKRLTDPGASGLELFTPGVASGGDRPSATIDGLITTDIVVEGDTRPIEVRLKDAREVIAGILTDADRALRNSQLEV